ncbi:vacuolar membrane protein-domain-containing protein [Phlebopus sp. FC_14]|nr:vacuolar membrane protein-domain-containing protein [Phlebopus sp. FC_14]
MLSLARLIDGSLDDLPLDRRSCQLLGPTALVVQGLMGVLAVLSLVYKRHRETQKRPWKIWLFDVSKQVAGQMFVHGLNVVISDFGSHQSSGNACTYYFLNILVDTTLGVGLIYLVLQTATFVLTKKLHLKGLQSGQYGKPPSFNYWARQTAVYVFTLTTMKLLVVALFAVWPGVSKLGDWLLSWTSIGDGEAFQVIFVMGIFPIIMNILQFWLIDSIVKASNNSVTPHSDSPRHSDSQDRQPLFHSPDDEDDIQPHDIESVTRPSNSRIPSGDDVKTIVGSEDDRSKASGSGSTTPLSFSKTTNQVAHDYPPSSVGSSSIGGTSISSRSRPKYRRSPPPALELHSAYSPAVNSPDPSSRRPSEHVDHENDSGEEFDAWEKDDWADRIGEEEWTGRRLEEKKTFLSDRWRSPALTGNAL